MPQPRVAVYDSLSGEYERAFAVFLAHTDQKDRARDWLDRFVDALPARRLFVDAGAGNGKVTAWYVDRFESTVAIEPNPHLRRELARACPGAAIVAASILDAPPPGPSDFVLSSHVFYYVPSAQWMANLERLASFLAPGGRLAVVLQNAATDCMRLVEHFLGHRFDLSGLRSAFEAAHGDRYSCRLETVASRIRAPDAACAMTIAEFMLNLLPMPEPPARHDVEEFLRQEFAAPGGRFEFTCSQDFLVVAPRR